MNCIYCTQKTHVGNSRSKSTKPETWRRRQCTSCGRVFTTYERPETDSLIVFDASRGATPFSFGKLMVSIFTAFAHTPDSAAQTSYELARTAEVRLLLLADNGGITPDGIAQTTHALLRRYDEAAAVQYGARHGILPKRRV